MKPNALLLATLLTIFLTACQSHSGRSSEPIELGDYKWELVALNGQAIQLSQARETPHLIFLEAEQRIAGSTGCNRIMGSYELTDKGHIHFGQLATTRMACPDMETEAAFWDALNNYDGAQFERGSFSLLNAAGERIARFVAKPLEVQ